MSQPDISLVYFRDAGEAIERVVVVDGQAQVRRLNLGEALQVATSIMQIASRIQQRLVEAGHE